MDGLLPVMNTCDGFSQYESYGYGATQRGLDLFQDDDESRGYLMKTSAPGRVYEMCPRSGRASVVVPFLEPQDGMDHSMYLFSFGCFSSCPGGMNRRSTQIIFTLENGGEILARKTMDIRICASPGRDFMRSEKQFLSANKCQRPALTQKSENQSDIDSQRSDTERPCKPSPKPRPAKRVCKSEDKGHATIQLDVEKISKKSEADTEVYCLLVRGRENFDLLCRLKEALEVLDHLKAEDIGKYKSTVLPSGKLSEIHDFYAAWKTEVKTKAKEDEPSSVHHESYSVRRSMSLDSMKPH